MDLDQRRRGNGAHGLNDSWCVDGSGFRGRFGRCSFPVRVSNDELLFEVLGRDFIQRTGCDASGGNAQLFRLGENLFVLQAELL